MHTYEWRNPKDRYSQRKKYNSTAKGRSTRIQNDH